MLNIKDALKRHGYTQRMVAKKLGMSEMNVSQIVNGNPTYNKMQAVADAIGADITAKAVLTDMNGRKFYFDIFAYDNTGLIAQGKHERFSVKIEKFMQKTNSKIRKE